MESTAEQTEIFTVNTPSQEDLLGYVLGALDAQEQRDLQQQIDSNPELENQLLEIRSSLKPLDYLETSGPRPGLARRTCETVASHQSHPQDLESVNRILNPPTTPMQRPDTNLNDELPVVETSKRRLLHVSSWSLTDMVTAAALLAMVAGILFPTISYARYNSRLTACQSNLQQLGAAFMNFSDANGGRFVEIPRSGPLSASGCFAPILKDQGWIRDDGLLACAGISSDTSPVYIPTIEVIKNATGEQLAHFQRTMSGHYGYTMGHCDNNGYCPPKNLGRTHAVLLADMPSLHLPGRRSANHAGRGQNCLFEDGSVRFVSGDSIGHDAIFVNDYNLVAPGCCPNDNVIAPSHLSPAMAVWKETENQ